MVTGKPQHDFVPEYPEAAVREAITNALCHRSYTDVGAIQVRIDDDCLEVWNPGRLPPDLSIRALYRRHASHPRNPLLAAAVFRTRLIEQWGTGALRIIDACRPFGIAVEFEQEMGMFVVRLRKARTAEVTPQVAPQVAPQVTPQVTPQVAQQVTPQVQSLLAVTREEGRSAMIRTYGHIRTLGDAWRWTGARIAFVRNSSENNWLRVFRFGTLSVSMFYPDRPGHSQWHTGAAVGEFMDKGGPEPGTLVRTRKTRKSSNV